MSRPARRLLALLGFLSLGPLLLATAPADSLDHAIEVQRAMLVERPGDGAVWSDLGNLLALAGDLEGAEQAYEEALRLDPELFDAHYNLGVLLLGEERFDAAASHLRKAASLDAASAWTRYHLGSSLRGRGKRAEAIRAYAQAFRLDPRLAFPDVNPDVIENPWLTESLLLAHRDQQPRGDIRPHAAEPAQIVSRPRSYSEPAHVASSPRSYSEPARIAELLVPHSASSERHSVAAPAGTPLGSTRTLAPAEPALAGPADDRGRALVPPLPDIDDRPAPAEARLLRRVGPDTNAASPPGIGAPAAAPTPETRRRVGPGDLSGSGLVDESDAPGNEEPPEATSPQTRFRPGRRSSAQLDLILLPRGAAAPHLGERPRTAAGR